MNTATQLLERCRDLLTIGASIHTDIETYLAKQQAVEIEPVDWVRMTEVQMMQKMWKAKLEWMEEAGIDTAGMHWDESLLVSLLVYAKAIENGTFELNASKSPKQVEQEPVYWDVLYHGAHVKNIYTSKSEAEEAMRVLSAKHEGVRKVVPLYNKPDHKKES